MSQETLDAPSVETSSAPQMVAVRRRRRRRRSEPQVNRRFLYALIVVFAVAVFLALVPAVRHPLMAALRSSKGKSSIPPEALALGVAALVLIYLIPGVEDKVLTALGIKKKSRHGHRR